MRFANMRLLGYDPLRSGTFWAALLAYLPLTTVQGTLLWLLRSFCPAEKLRILRSAALALYVLAAVPYLFVCRLTYWLPLTNEELTTAVPVLLTGCCVLALLVNISFLSYAIAEEEKRTMLQLRIAAEQQQQQYLLRKTAVVGTMQVPRPEKYSALSGAEQRSGNRAGAHPADLAGGAAL